MIGRRFGQFEITAKLGEGGMGVVYEAQDTELDRKVALKLLPPATCGDEQRLERFRREARAVAALNHPNIVTIHGIERTEDKTFLVMERIDGESLDRRIRSGGLSLAEFFDIAIPIADAMSAAHAAGVVHRDLKPANVMVTRNGLVKVLDFGLAKIATDAEPGEGGSPTQLDTRTGALTSEGSIVGTAAYMSPEQLQGQEVDARSDIFSLGIVLYEMATGVRPFSGGSGIAMASSILKDQPSSVSDRRGGLPRHLGRIIQQCLEKNPDHRFQTAQDVRNQLATLQREATSGEASSPGRSPMPRRGNVGLGIAAVAGAVVIALVGWAASTFLGRDEGQGNVPATAAQPGKVPKIVVLPFENLGEPDDQYFADGMTEEITSRLAALRGLGVISRTSALQYKDARPPIGRIAEELGVDYVLEGTVRWQHAADGPSRVRVTPQLIRVAQDTHVWSERYNAVLADIFEVQSDIARQVSEALGIALLEPQRSSLEAPPTDDLEAYDAYLRANDYFTRGQELNSHEAVRLSIPMYEEAVRLDPEFALAHVRQAIAHDWLYNTYEDFTIERRAAAEAAVGRAFELDPGLPEAHYARGLLYQSEQPADNVGALRAFRRALEDRPSSSEIHAAVGGLLAELGQWEEALASMAKATELNPRVGHLPCSTGGVSWYMRRFDEAITYHQRAIHLTPDRACPYYCKVFIYLNADGTTDRARRALAEIPSGVDLEDSPPINYPWVMADIFDGRYEDALERLDSGPSEVYDFLQFAVPKSLLAAQIHTLRGSPEQARRAYEDAAGFLETWIAERPDDMRVRGSLGIAYAALGRRDEALAEGETALEMLGGSQGGDLGERLIELAHIHVLLGEHDTAIDYLERVLATPSPYAAPYLRADPTWEALRDEPRFQAMLSRHGA